MIDCSLKYKYGSVAQLVRAVEVFGLKFLVLTNVKNFNTLKLTDLSWISKGRRFESLPLSTLFNFWRKNER